MTLKSLGFVGILWLVPLYSCREPVPSKAASQYAADAAGAPAQVLNSWPITFDEDDDRSRLPAAAVCGEHGYIADIQSRAILDIDLSAGREVGLLPWPAKSESYGHPLVMTADYGAKVVYVTGETGAVAFSTEDRTVKKGFPFPAGFVAARGSVVLDGSSNTLFVSGLWSNHSEWKTRTLDRMLVGSKVGLRLSLLNGVTESLLDGPIESGCPVMDGSCFETLLAINPDAKARDRYFVAHKLSKRIGVYDAAGTLSRSFSVESPRFKSDGHGLRHGAPLGDVMKWRGTNSIIEAIYIYGSVVAVVHMAQVPSENWRPGDWINFDVYFNTYSLDGSGLISDLRLPSPPKGADAHGIYIVDFGPEGHRDNPRAVTLRRIAVPIGPQLPRSS